MEKEDFKLQKKLAELKHGLNLRELEMHHKNKLEEIKIEREARLDVELATHDHKLSFHRLKRADERMKRANNW